METTSGLNAAAKQHPKPRSLAEHDRIPRPGAHWQRHADTHAALLDTTSQAAPKTPEHSRTTQVRVHWQGHGVANVKTTHISARSKLRGSKRTRA